MAERADPLGLLLEVGTEELPPGSVAAALQQLAQDAGAALHAAGLEHGPLQTTGTLRRLVLMAEQVGARQLDRVTEVRGPAARTAYDASGAPTQAAIGFARSQGIPVEALQVRDLDGGRRVVAEVREKGRPALEVLGQILPGVVAGLSFAKSMWWSTRDFRFGRPIRWVVALLGRRVISMEMAGVRAGRRTAGHRFLAPGAIILPTAATYPASMRRGHVILEHTARLARILEGAEALAADIGGVPVIDPALRDELVWSTEHPTPVLGTFDQALAAVLPREVVLVTLQHHQKSFGVQDTNGSLLPAFIAVRDGGTSHLATVRTGHEWVVRARLEDARFFLEEDRRGGFAQWNAELARLAHVTGLGSMAEHVQRIERLAGWLADAAGVAPAERQTLDRAARLCKADLVTALVREFPELQGTIGRIYATQAGEPSEVATAIEEHYWPTSAGGTVPRTLPGALLAVADRSLLLVGATLAGLVPSGSQDPYGLRRAASGIVAILLAHHLRIQTRALLDSAAATLDGAGEARVRAQEACFDLILQRLRGLLMDQGIAHDTVLAVMAVGPGDLVDFGARARALQAIRADPVMPRLATAYARASRILAQAPASPALNEDALVEPAEVSLFGAWRGVINEMNAYETMVPVGGATWTAAMLEKQYAGMLAALVKLADPIDRFFDNVLVMAPDPDIRGNRLALLRDVTNSFVRVADFSKLAG
ncbi:MAG: glycine--tRNA ligase subunit beta [Armatimonadota bacterium]